MIFKKKSWRKYREIENKMNEENEPLGSEEKLGMIANIMDKALIRKPIEKHVLVLEQPETNYMLPETSNCKSTTCQLRGK